MSLPPDSSAHRFWREHEEHRLVYRVENEVIHILSCKHHYQ
ncbi:type II toxin-antitoxin system YoeB family toxin [Nocardia callitridis]